MTYSAEVLADSPAGYWRLGEASGTTLNDSSGNSHSGTYTSVTLGATGALAGDSDTAATFNGSSSHADVAYASWMGVTTALSVEAWIKTTATGIHSLLDRDSTWYAIAEEKNAS